MMEEKNLNLCVCEENAAKLANVISDFMIQNKMTLENLDCACEIVEDAFRKNATVKGIALEDVLHDEKILIERRWVN